MGCNKSYKIIILAASEMISVVYFFCVCVRVLTLRVQSDSAQGPDANLSLRGTFSATRNLRDVGVLGSRKSCLGRRGR